MNKRKTGKFYKEVDNFVKEYLITALKLYNGNVSLVANHLELERSHLHRLLRSYNLSTRVDRYKAGLHD